LFGGFAPDQPCYEKMASYKVITCAGVLPKMTPALYGIDRGGLPPVAAFAERKLNNTGAADMMMSANP
jgi:hypothetical protein